MSAFRVKADISHLATNVRYGPKADIGFGLGGRGSRYSRQDNPDFRELARLRIDLDRAAMLPDDDVVTDGKTQAGAFPSRLRRKEGIEHLFLHVRLNPGAIVADFDFNAVAKAFR